MYHDKTKLLLQGGILFDINDNISLFTSYSEGMKAPGWANWWVIGSLTRQGVWSETKPICVKFNTTHNTLYIDGGFYFMV